MIYTKEEFEIKCEKADKVSNYDVVNLIFSDENKEEPIHRINGNPHQAVLWVLERIGNRNYNVEEDVDLLTFVYSVSGDKFYIIKTVNMAEEN